MTVAYIAYRNLTPQTRARVDALLKLNPQYGKWIDGVAPGQQGLVAFMQAATWADFIKERKNGYTFDGVQPPGNPTDPQNIGYADLLEHQYWHYIDVPYAAGAPGTPPPPVNALTEIELMTAALGSNASDDVKSYDVAWLEHIIGDVHQPLHTVSRFTKNHPQGDEGGNFVYFCEKPCTDQLHKFWDGMFGDHPSIAEVMKSSQQLLAQGKPAGADQTDPSTWIDDSFELTKSSVYASPIGADNDPAVKLSPRPDAAYTAQALAVAQMQVRLAGYRLAATLNANLR